MLTLIQPRHKSISSPPVLGGGRLAALIVFLVSLTGCGALKPGSGATPEAEATVISVVNSYLNHVVRGDESRIGPMIVWSEFLGLGTEKISREEFRRQFTSLQNRWPHSDHPLVGLSLKRITIDDDDAIVRLQKPSSANAPEVWVKLIWSGSGWLILEDSLFGKDKLASGLT